MTDSKPESVPADRPAYRPLERFWPYADLPEAPSDEELMALRPELRAAIFGEPDLPFSISIEFEDFDGDEGARARALAAASDEHAVHDVEGVRRHRARFVPSDRPLRLRDLWEVVGPRTGTEVLIDGQPLPYARQLWLPLVWFLIR